MNAVLDQTDYACAQGVAGATIHTSPTRPWHDQYPHGVPAQIADGPHGSLVDLLEQ